jgi:hypothetical protein
MTVTAASFRGSFPEFTSIQTYPAQEVQFWVDLAAKLHNAARWGDTLDFGVQLFVAHNLSLQFNANAAAKTGGNPGAVIGTVTSGSVDKVSYSRDASTAMDPKNGHWNLSSYGLRWIRLSRMMGAGPVYVGAPSVDEQSQQAWPGPYTIPNPV